MDRPGGRFCEMENRSEPKSEEMKQGESIGVYKIAKKLLSEEIEKEVSESDLKEFAQMGIGHVYRVWNSEAKKICHAGIIQRRYLCEKLLGKGGMGAVYQTYDTALNRAVALKAILSRSESSLDSFQKEATTLAKLYHPNIVGIYDFGISNGNGYFTMRLVEGQNLEEWIKERFPKESGKAEMYRHAAEILEKVARGIAYAHENKVIHRDLKPANILMEFGSKIAPVVTDFGLAIMTGAVQDDTVIGTLSHMPPEQAMSSEEREREKVGVNEQSDVYSLGAVLYHLLLGRPPFDVMRYTSRSEILADIANGKFNRRIRRRNKAVPEEMESICLKAMERKPADRYESALAMAEDLRRFLQGESVEAVTSRVYRFKMFMRRQKLVSTIIVSLCLVVIGALWLSSKLYRSEKESQRQRIIAERNEAEARRQTNLSRLNEIDAKLEQVQARLSEAHACISNILMLSEARNYFLANQKNERVRQICEEGQKMLGSLQTAEIVMESGELNARLRQILEKSEGLKSSLREMARKSRRLARYRILPNCGEVREISMPAGLEQYPTPQPSWTRFALRESHVFDRVTLWNCETNQRNEILHAENVLQTAFSPDNAFFASGDIGGNVQLLDLSRGTSQTLRMPSRNGVLGLRFSPDSRLLLAVTKRYSLLWKVDGQLQDTLPYNGSNGYRSCFSPDGRWLVMIGLMGTEVGTYLWDVRERQPFKSIPFYGEAVCTNHDGSEIAIGSREKILVWNPKTGSETIWEGHEGEIVALSWSEDGRFLASLGKDQMVILRNGHTGKKIFAWCTPDANAHALSFCRREKRNALGVWGSGRFNRYSLEPSLEKQISLPPLAEQIVRSATNQGVDSSLKKNLGIAINPVNPEIIAGCIGPLLFLWDTEKFVLNGQEDLRPSEGMVTQMGFSGDGDFLVYSKQKTSLKRWDVREKEHFSFAPPLFGHARFYEGRKMLLLPGSSLLQFWTLGDRGATLDQELKVPEEVSKVAFGKNAQGTSWLAAGGDKAIVMLKQNEKGLWETGSTLHGDPKAICFSEEGKRLATGFENGWFILWDWANRSEVVRLRLSSPIQKILYDPAERLYWIVTPTSAFVYEPEENGSVNLYPLEIFAGYLKTGTSVSSDFQRVVFISAEFKMLVFSLPS